MIKVKILTNLFEMSLSRKTREDFPDGPEGDKAYAKYVQTRDADAARQRKKYAARKDTLTPEEEDEIRQYDRGRVKDAYKFASQEWRDARNAKIMAQRADRFNRLTRKEQERLLARKALTNFLLKLFRDMPSEDGIKFRKQIRAMIDSLPDKEKEDFFEKFRVIKGDDAARGRARRLALQPFLDKLNK